MSSHYDPTRYLAENQTLQLVVPSLRAGAIVDIGKSGSMNRMRGSIRTCTLPAGA